MGEDRAHWSSRLPFYYGWLIVGIAFVTMAIGVTVRTAFSLLMPPLIEEFRWDRGLAAGAFSFGFLVSAVLSPIVGRVMDAQGPRIVILTGVALMSAGLFLAPPGQWPDGLCVSQHGDKDATRDHPRQHLLGQ
jgi:MFS family permease